MRLNKSPQGHYTAEIDGTEIVLYLTEDLLPLDDSLEKLEYMARTFDVDRRIIGLPDLHFKIKNFVPSGMTIPVRNYFSPQLLGPNNDGMGSLRFRIKGESLSEEIIDALFTRLKKRIAMFRRDDDIVGQDVLELVFRSGVRDIISDWGFQAEDLLKFEDQGCVHEFAVDEDVSAFFPDERPESLPEFVPGHDIYKRGGKCIGVLDGTSHFIELFQLDRNMNDQQADILDVTERDYFFLIHAGAGDICITSHRAYLGRNDNKYYPGTEEGDRALNSFAVAGNYGHANRLYIYKVLKEVIEECVPDLVSVEIFSDVPHDYIEYQEDSAIFIHRKGAAKLFPGGYYPEDHSWRQTGTPYLFPSCVGGDAYIITNVDGNDESFNTVSHGAGRLIRKDRAIDLFRDSNLNETMKHKIKLFRYGVDQIEGQNPLAFKDIDTIMQTFQDFNLAYPVSKLKPLASLKA